MWLSPTVKRFDTDCVHGENVEKTWKHSTLHAYSVYQHGQKQVWLTRRCRTGHYITLSCRLVVMATCSSPDEVVQVLFFRIKVEWESYTIYKYLNQGKQPYPYIHATRYDSKSAIVFTWSVCVCVCTCANVCTCTNLSNSGPRHCYTHWILTTLNLNDQLSKETKKYFLANKLWKKQWKSGYKQLHCCICRPHFDWCMIAWLICGNIMGKVKLFLFFKMTRNRCPHLVCVE